MKKSIINLVNFRDLGGIKNKDGKKIKSGYIYRSSAPNKLSNRQKNMFNKLGIKHIFDYRGEQEIAVEPDYIGNATYHSLPALKRSESAVPPSVYRKIISEAGAKEVEISKSLFIQDYKEMPFDSEAYRKTLLSLNDFVPIFFHCQAGKDRTGIAAMLILKMFNVDEDVIVENYLESNEYRRKINNRNIWKLKYLARNPYGVKFYKNIGICKEEYIRATMDEIARRYESYQDFLRNEYGIDEKMVSKLKDFYLE